MHSYSNINRLYRAITTFEFACRFLYVRCKQRAVKLIFAFFELHLFTKVFLIILILCYHNFYFKGSCEHQKGRG